MGENEAEDGHRGNFKPKDSFPNAVKLLLNEARPHFLANDVSIPLSLCAADLAPVKDDMYDHSRDYFIPAVSRRGHACLPIPPIIGTAKPAG